MIDEKLKEQVMQYVDGELPAQERANVEQALKQSSELKAYHDELVRLEGIMDQWSDLDRSADWERKLNKHLADAGIMEDKGMKKASLKQWATVAVLIIVGIFSMQTYSQRAIQARIRDAATYMKSTTDNLGSGAQYEPYYQSSNYISNDKGQRISQINNQRIIPNVSNRKIIQTVHLSLEVPNSSAAQTQINLLVSHYNGIIASSSLNTTVNGTTASITFKVLPAHLSAVLSEIHTLGKVENEKMTGEDVTAQYVDIEGRLKNLKVERERLIKLMDEKPGKITDVLEVERELSRVTGEIESMEGQLNLLANLSELATVTVEVHEPPKVAPKPGFWSSLHISDRLSCTIHTCVDVCLSTFNGIIITLGFVFPVVILMLIVWGVVRFIRKRINKK